MSAVSDGVTPEYSDVGSSGVLPKIARIVGWILSFTTLVYIINNYLNVWWGWPGAAAILGDNADSHLLSGIQNVFYLLGFAAVILFVFRTPDRSLRKDSESLRGIVNYIIRAAFWAVIFIGVVDAIISFLRVEDILPALVGDQMTSDLGRSHFRGPYVHFPLIILSLIVAARTKTLGFQWLALLVVVAEMSIVVTRFVFSYEQAFQGDLVRFWYGALFLFASAYTLFEDGHVRVDVLYAGFSTRTKGIINTFGCIVLGTSLCWVILIFGMWDQSSIINTSIFNYEVSQSGFGMYVKFWMAGFLAVFAVSMTVQFCSYMMESVADILGEPGHREPPPTGGPA